MSTAYAPGTHLHRRHVNRWLVAVVALAAALVGLGTWVVVDRTTGGGGASQDATTLIDNYNADVISGKVDAATAMFTPDAVIWEAGAIQAAGTKQIWRQIASVNQGHFDLKRVAPVTVDGNFASTYFEGATPILSVFQLKNGKIYREWDFELGQTAPFDNADITAP